ncbi:hypothetical protein SAMD00019534_049720 [Acytostelium subglobosum LB1]|uniref:hypothetical protein n=1 Tax=Acytostelium subglobosum LB1 TaxID=1410327 RepID=UPI0006447B12|nr:hypothetical protein SAMD00019534_049720 [Acytostelium subglobosum LB1]GAM21797.1 hypothetical protein SAMD00019534_049720 [Acytostelium subglobosum LB1]|eukprot:XP_012754897.1 hypothetical protein SAMD00019534_049720 [Acytostelium subglobosum LB1]
MVPSHIESLNAQGRAYLMLGQPAKALNSFTTCRNYLMMDVPESDIDLHFTRNLHHLQYNIAKSLSMLGQNDAATKLLESILSIRSTQPLDCYQLLLDLYQCKDQNIIQGIDRIMSASDSNWDPVPLCVYLINELDNRKIETPQVHAKLNDIVLGTCPNIEEFDQNVHCDNLYECLLRRTLLDAVLSPDTYKQRLLDLMHIKPKEKFGFNIRILLLTSLPSGSQELHQMITEIESNESLVDSIKGLPYWTQVRLEKLVATMKTMSIEDAREYLKKIEESPFNQEVGLLYTLIYLTLAKEMIMRSERKYCKDFSKFVEWLPGGRTNELVRQLPWITDPTESAKQVHQRCVQMIAQLDTYHNANGSSSSSMDDIRYMYELLEKTTAIPLSPRGPEPPVVSVHNQLLIDLIDQKFISPAKRYHHWDPFARVKWDSLDSEPSLDTILKTLTTFIHLDYQYTPDSVLKTTKQSIDANPEYSIGYLVHSYMSVVKYGRSNLDVMNSVNKAIKLDRYRDQSEREYGQILLALTIVGLHYNEQSVNILQSLLEANPNHKEALHSLALVYLWTNMLNEAEQHITTRVLTAYPDSVHARITLAYCRDMRGVRTGAQEAYQTIYDLGLESPSSTTEQNRMIQEGLFGLEIKSLLDDMKEFVSNYGNDQSMPIRQAYDIITFIHITLKEIDMALKTGELGGLSAPEDEPYQSEYLITLDYFIRESIAISLMPLAEHNIYSPRSVYHLVVLVHTFLGKAYSTIPERSSDAIRHLRASMSFSWPAFPSDNDIIDKVIIELKSVAEGLLVPLLMDLKRYDELEQLQIEKTAQ